MMKRKLWTFLITYIFYAIYLIMNCHLGYYRIYEEVLSVREINIFTGVDPNLFTRDILVFLLFILIFIPPIKSFELTRMTRTRYFQKCIPVLMGCSFVMAITNNIIKTVLMIVKFYSVETLFHSYYFHGLILTVLLYWICFMVVGMLYLIFMFLCMRKWRAAILTIVVMTGLYLLYRVCKVPLLFADTYIFNLLYAENGRIMGVPYIQWGTTMIKYSLITMIMGIIACNLFHKQNVVRDVL